ncbi:hypothetical protein [Streptomyces sp. OK228]|uniref:hypothetical protein n=1 Tax=Streptomyces sp. OK228 TaxID=1882786 RepID=UPI000BC5C79B|nr:hypothetical protein [Streptomyces sp. OK228]SOE31751.1 hypothetical protein SAMN05442782_8684 [Streptomyces sp. OK228]
MNTTAKAAQQIARLVGAEDALTTARREEARTAKTAERATARAKAARAKVAPARTELRKAERAGKGVAAAIRRLAARMAKAADLAQTARQARYAARLAARAATTAARRLDRLALRAATTASRMVGEVAERMGRRTTAAPEQDKTLPVEELPAVEEIEAHADRFKDLDAEAKAQAKLADAEKKWLRRLPVGQYGRVIVTRTNGGTVLDGDQVAVDYLDNGMGVPPRKGRKDTFKVAVEAPAVETADQVALVIAA